MRIGAALIALLAAACVVRTQPAARAPARRTPIPAAPQVDDSGSLSKLTEESDGWYSLDEAVADALSGPLTYLGKGPWHGIFRISACAYRNDRVLVVNVYCTRKEMSSFRVDVYSPARGRVTIYAEAGAPISTITRAAYFTFKAEEEPAPAPDAGLPALSLEMSFEDLQAYEELRYQKFLPSCYGGVELRKPQGGCLGALASHASEWKATNDAFLQAPPDDWYRLVKELRELARVRHKK